jgi:hypothetical protein
MAQSVHAITYATYATSTISYLSIASLRREPGVSVGVHRGSHIATTSGPKESLIHLIMLGEIGTAVTAAMSFEINAAVILLMIIVWATHEATALWDITFAHHKREVTPIEQWVHSYLGVLPLLSVVLVVVLHWTQFLALFGLGSEAPRFEIVWKDPPLPWSYVLSVIAATIVFEVLPYLEELIRGLRAWSRSRWVEYKSTSSSASTSP